MYNGQKQDQKSCTGCSDDKLPWRREGDFLDTKYPYVCHAELNAVLNSVPGNLNGCSMDACAANFWYNDGVCDPCHLLGGMMASSRLLIFIRA